MSNIRSFNSCKISISQWAKTTPGTGGKRCTWMKRYQMEIRLRIQANNFSYTFQHMEIKKPYYNVITLIMFYTGRSAGYTCPSDKNIQILGQLCFFSVTRDRVFHIPLNMHGLRVAQWWVSTTSSIHVGSSYMCFEHHQVEEETSLSWGQKKNLLSHFSGKEFVTSYLIYAKQRNQNICFLMEVLFLVIRYLFVFSDKSTIISFTGCWWSSHQMWYFL